MNSAHANTGEFPLKGNRYKGGEPAQDMVNLVNFSLYTGKFSRRLVDLLLHNFSGADCCREILLWWWRVIEFNLEKEFCPHISRLRIYFCSEFYYISDDDLLLGIPNEERFCHKRGSLIVNLGFL